MLAVSAISVGSAAIAENIFALVPKNMNNPFFDQARDGCKKAEAESNGAFKCEYIGPGEHGGGDEQVQIVMDLIARGDVKGLGISPSNAAAMSVAAEAAREAGIPVITWDSDLLDTSLRVAYIGTHNYEIGVNLAKLTMEIKPNGGTVCIQSGGAAAANHNERMQGIRDTLGGMAMGASESPGNRLEDTNGWTEAKGCPLYTDDDFPRSVQQFEDFMAANPDVDAFLPTGGFPQFVPDANRAAVEPYKGKIADGSLALVVADTLPVQIDQMKEGFSAGQVGQRPFEMGYRVMLAFQKMAEGGDAPADPTYTGLDVCTPETADTCIAQ
ncbi:MAG: substrate-binding domain-containing protein [Alphaproteobacteria bacterium]